MSAQSESQKVLLSEQPEDDPLVIRGPYKVCLRDQFVTYFLLLGKIRPEIKNDTDPDGMPLVKYK